MTTTMTISGMSCEHCAGKVKVALEGISEVTEAAVSLDDRSATVTTEREVPTEQFASAIAQSGYEFVDIR